MPETYSTELRTLIGTIEQLRAETDRDRESSVGAHVAASPETIDLVVRACDQVVNSLSYREVELPSRFRLIRDTDVTGVSGAGHIADGVEWVDGRVTLRWRTDPSSTSDWDSLEDAVTVHGHDGATRVEWIDSGARPVPDRDTTEMTERVALALEEFRRVAGMLPEDVRAVVVEALEVALVAAGELQGLRVRMALMGQALSL